MSTATIEPTCRYCLPKGGRATARSICERHTTLFKKLDYIIYGNELTRMLTKTHDEGNSLILVMSGEVPKVKSGAVFGEVVSYELNDRRHHWVLRDLNGRLWAGDSMRRDLVRFHPHEVDTEAN